jgi:hypothetical protein
MPATRMAELVRWQRQDYRRILCLGSRQDEMACEQLFRVFGSALDAAREHMDFADDIDL